MKSSRYSTTVEHQVKDLKSDMTKSKQISTRTSASESGKLDIDDTCESNVDSGFLSGSCISGSWDTDDQSSSNLKIKSDAIVDSRTENLCNKSTRSDIPSNIIKHNNSWIKEAFEPDEEGDTHLHLAVIDGTIRIENHLIENVPESSYLDCMNDLHQSPLHLAVLTHQPSIVRKLICYGSSLDLRDRYGNTPLHIACTSGDLNCVKQLTVPFSYTKSDSPSRNVPNLPQDLTLRNYDGFTCFHLATFAARIDIMEHLAKYGADVNARDDRDGWTCLHYSVDALNVYVTKFLLEKCRSDPKVQNFRNIQPLHLVLPILNSKNKNLYKKALAIRDILMYYGASVQQSQNYDSDSDDDDQYDSDVSDNNDS